MHVKGLIIKGHGSRIGDLKIIDASEQGGFAGAGRSENGNHIAFVHMQAHIVQRLQADCRRQILFRHIRYRQEFDIRAAGDFNLLRFFFRKGRDDHGIIHDIGFRLGDL